MKRILCVTPNPALDLGGVVDKIIPNEKTYVADESRFPGGNAINVSRALFRLGIPVISSGFLGGSTGSEVEELLQREGLSTSFVELRNHTRISVTVSNRADHQQTRLSFPGPRIFGDELASMRKKINSAKSISHLVIGGSLPPNLSTNEIKKWIKAANSRKIEVVVDCPAKVSRELLREKMLFAKPNLVEFQELTQTRAKTISQILKLGGSQFPNVELLCVSSVEGGALLMTPNAAYFGRIPKVKVKSSVGAGDSMVAGILSRHYLKDFAGENLLAWGLASSAATLMHEGTRLGTGPEIKRLVSQVKIKTYKLSRQ